MECIEQGVVARLQGGDAIVVATRADACAACSAKGTCNAIGGASTSTEVRASNEIGARPGDRVAVSLPGSSVVSAAGVLYFMPAVGLITGALIGHFAASAEGLDPDLGAAVGALAALAVSLALVALLGRRLGRRRAFTPRISQVLAEGSVVPLQRGADGGGSTDRPA